MWKQKYIIVLMGLFKNLTKKKSPKGYISKKEYWIYGVAALGQGMIYTTMSSYVSDFYLNVLGLAPLFVMLLMLLARVWDAINDPIMGMIVDRHDSKYGKYKPYVIYTFLPIALLTFLMFYYPSFANKHSSDYNELGTYFWVAIIYVLWGMVYTVSDIPFWSLPNALTPDAAERGKTFSFSKTLNGIGSVVPMGIVMILGFFDISYETRYMIMSIVASVCGGLLFLASYFTVKERVKIPRVVKSFDRVSPISMVLKYRPLACVIAMGILSSGRYMIQAGTIYVSRYTFYINGMTIAASQSTVQLVFSIVTAVGMFGAMLICPLLFKKLSYKAIVLGSCVIGGIAGLLEFVVGYFTNYNVWFLIPFILISSMPLGFLNILGYAMIGDCLDGYELKTGIRDNGLGLACQTFVNKLGNALATTMIISMYLILGINVENVAGGGAMDAVDPTTLSNGIRVGMFLLVSIIPAVSLFLCCIPMLFYDLTGEKKKKMLEELVQSRIDRGIEMDATDAAVLLARGQIDEKEDASQVDSTSDSNNNKE